MGGGGYCVVIQIKTQHDNSAGCLIEAASMHSDSKANLHTPPHLPSSNILHSELNDLLWPPRKMIFKKENTNKKEKTDGSVASGQLERHGHMTAFLS